MANLDSLHGNYWIGDLSTNTPVYMTLKTNTYKTLEGAMDEFNLETAKEVTFTLTFSERGSEQLETLLELACRQIANRPENAYDIYAVEYKIAADLLDAIRRMRQ
jgi:uncharacterized protein YcnI